MGAAIDKALDMIAEQKAKYNQYGTPYSRPWIFCITDGGPNDSYATAAQRLKEMEDATKVLGYCVGVANFDRHTMASIFNPERIFELDNLNFPALFKFVSSSLATVRNSDPNGGRSVAVEAPGDLHTINVAFKREENTMLGYYKMSIIGTAHQAKKDGVCQDASDVAVLKNGWIVAAIADGLGSAKNPKLDPQQR